MTQNEMIVAIYDGMQDLKTDMRELKDRVQVLEEDVSVLKENVSVLKEDVSVLKKDVSVLKEDVSVLKEDVSVLKEDVSVLKEDVSVLKEDVSGIHLTLENVTNRNIRVVAEGHLDLSRKLDEALKADTERELMHLRVNVLENDMRRVKEKVGIA